MAFQIRGQLHLQTTYIIVHSWDSVAKTRSRPVSRSSVPEGGADPVSKQFVSNTDRPRWSKLEWAEVGFGKGDGVGSLIWSQ